MMLESIRLQSLFDFDDVCAGQAENATSLIETCRLDTEFLQSSLIAFNLVTGGMLGVIFWAVIALSVYLKYGNFILSALVGVPILMTAAIALPTHSDIYVGILLALGIAVTIFVVIWKIPRD